MQRADSLEETQMLGWIDGRRRRGWQRMKWLDGIIDTIDMNLRKLWEIPEDREEPILLQPMGLPRRLSSEELMLSNCGAGEDS